MKALRDTIIIEPLKEGIDSLSLPDTVKESMFKGKVFDIGPLAKEVKKHIKKGDLIVFSKAEGTIVEDKGKKYFLISQNKVLAKL